MLQILYPTYTLRLRIQDRGDLIRDKTFPHIMSNRYYDSASGKTGCDDVLTQVREALTTAGIVVFELTLDCFDHEG